MALNSELDALIQKRLKQDLKAVEIVQAPVLVTLIFGCLLNVSCFSVRYGSPALYFLSVALFMVVAAGLTFNAVMQYRNRRSSRNWIVLAVSSCLAVAVAGVLGNRYWYAHTASYYYLQEMASYADIDPSSDRGQSYMDAGTIYFKEGVHVERSKPVGFRNGLKYCVAPIVRTPLKQNSSVQNPDTFNRFVLPRSGTVDFWAVGIDCCGDTFYCDQSDSELARSGLRSLNEHHRAMYLLAVQEWSAATGLPVRHPVFFHWVKDPLSSMDNILSQATTDFTIWTLTCLGVSFVMSFFCHFILQKIRVP